MKLFIGHQNLNMNYCSSRAKTCNSCSIRIFTYLQQQTHRQELFLDAVGSKKIAICSSTATVVLMTLFRSDKGVEVRKPIQFAFVIVSRCVGRRFKISKQYKIKIIPQP